MTSVRRGRNALRGLDLVILNGKVTDGELWPNEYQAIGIQEGRIVTVGSNEEVENLIGARTEVLDVEGRRVIPGLIDGHLHLVRTGQTYAMATSWSGIRSLKEGFDRLDDKRQRTSGKTWLYVPGGWTEDQVAEHRGPTKDELDERFDEAPTYVQCAYDYAVLNSSALSELELSVHNGDLPSGSVERDESGMPTGRITGLPAYQVVLDDAVGVPGLEQQAQGTARFLSELRRLGLTGAVDVGGFRTRPESYDAVHLLNGQGKLDFRLRLYVHPGEPGNQVEQTRNWVRHARPRSGDPFLQIVGLGELVHYEGHDLAGYDPSFRITPTALGELGEISQLAADYGFALHAHAIMDESVESIIHAWETIDDISAIRALRFSIAHGELASEKSLQRLASLGAGIGVQSRMIDTGVPAYEAWGDGYVNAPKIGLIEKLGIPLGGGTDGAVGHTYNPWEALWWFTTGSSFGPVPQRDEEHRLTRARALAIYTRGSAWFSFEEHERGGIRPGDLADLAILTDDYFTIDADAIPDIEAWATVVDGRIVYGPVTQTT